MNPIDEEIAEAAINGALPENQYDLVTLVGRGASGAVYRGRERFTQRAVALKVLLLTDDEARLRIDREIRALSQLHENPYILSLINGYFAPDNKSAVLVFPFVDGGSVESIVEGFGQGLPNDVVAAIARQICLALSYLEENLIVHGDLKPTNILIDRRGFTKICDFGIARFAETGPSDQPNSDRGKFVGTLRYSAPEVIQGSSGVSPANDIYSCGVTMLYMVLGRQPFESASIAELVSEIQTGGFLNELPKSFRSSWGHVLSATLNVDPKNRPRAKELLELLRTEFQTHDKSDAEIVAEFLKDSGNFRQPPPNPPVAVNSSPEPDGDDSLKGLIQSLAFQMIEVQAAIADLTARFSKQELIASGDARMPSPEARIESTFAAVRRRLELNWRISLFMTGLLFSLFVAMMILAVVFGIIYQKSYWSIVFGGASAVSLMTVVVWKPMDKMLFATIATQQLELIQLNYQRALKGVRAERREAFRDMSTQLNVLLAKVSTKPRS